MRTLAVVLLLGSVAWAETAPSEAKATGWKVHEFAPSSARVGQRATLEIVVEAQAGYHLNDDYPINFKPDASSAARFDSARIEKSAAALTACSGDDKHMCVAKMPVAFVGTTAGSARLGGTLAFSACNEAQCLIQKVAVSAPVSIGK